MGSGEREGLKSKWAKVLLGAARKRLVGCLAEEFLKAEILSY